MPQIPQQILDRPARLLYMTPLALGDFLYQSGFLRQIKQQYPQLTIDVWFDDLRKRPKSWHQGRNKTLGQWLETVDYIDQIYPIPDSAAERDSAVQKALQLKYDVVFFLSKSRVARYEKYARLVCPDGFVAAVAASKDRLKRLLFGSKPDLLLPIEDFSLADGAHVSQFYAHFFHQVFDLDTGAVQPVMEIPDAWKKKVAETFGGIREQGRKLILINYLSTNRSHDLSLDAVLELTEKMVRLQPQLDFILCVAPHEFEKTDEACKSVNEKLAGKVRPFTAREHFFELPALVDYCDFTLSVDTSVVHFASALKRPLVALMRSNNRQWRPLESSTTTVVYAAGKNWGQDIPLDDIITACDGQGFFNYE